MPEELLGAMGFAVTQKVADFASVATYDTSKLSGHMKVGSGFSILNVSTHICKHDLWTGNDGWQWHGCSLNRVQSTCSQGLNVFCLSIAQV